MAVLVIFIVLLIKFIKSDHDVCNYDCSYATLDKPCKSLDEEDIKCIDYKYNSVCPDGYKDCAEYSNACNKECSYQTKGKPCMHLSIKDNTCFDYIDYGVCPPKTKDCSQNIKKSCEYCNKYKPCLYYMNGDYKCLDTDKYGECIPGSTLCGYDDENKYDKNCNTCTKDKPCLHDDYVFGEYKCYEQIYKNNKYICPDESSLCHEYDPSICDKKCSDKTKGKPCIHINKDDNTCFDYLEYGGCPPGTKDCSNNVEYGGCPPGTKDCSNNVQNPCEYCNKDKPCLHDNYDDYSCLDTNKYGNLIQYMTDIRVVSMFCCCS